MMYLWQHVICDEPSKKSPSQAWHDQLFLHPVILEIRGPAEPGPTAVCYVAGACAARAAAACFVIDMHGQP